MDQRFLFIRFFSLFFILVSQSVFCLGQEKFILQKGKTIDSLFCEKQMDHSYAYYLPSNYDLTKKWPVVYIFEPMARGALPVDSFKMAAEKYGYILVGSNNSRNGSWNNMIEAANHMIEDVSNRFSVDVNRIYTAGFSGGSRAATMVAAVTGEVAGVIGCGAALPNREDLLPTDKSDYVYFGLVGDKDMNYQEMYVHDDSLMSWNFHTRLRIFPAGHKWPSSHLFLEAIEWMELQAMKKELLAKDSLFLIEQKKQFIQYIEKLKKEKNLVDLARNYQYLLKDFSRDSLDIYVEESKQLIESDAYQNALKKWTQTREKEFALGQKYQLKIQKVHWAKTIMDVNRNWWKKESNKLYQLEKSQSVLESQMASRLLNLIIASSIGPGWTYLRNKNYEKAILFFNLRTFIQPNEPWSYENLARAQILNGNKKAAIRSLKKAIDLGLDKNYVKNQTLFDELRNSKKINKLLAN